MVVLSIIVNGVAEVIGLGVVGASCDTVLRVSTVAVGDYNTFFPIVWLLGY